MSVSRWSIRAMGIVLLLSLAACTTGGGASPGSGPGTPIAVTDVKSIAGQWVGLMDLPGGGSGRSDQYIEVMVRDDGTYEAKSARTIGIMDARGTIAVRDGRLVLQGAGGAQGTATLVSREGGRALMVEMRDPNQGGKVTARLRPGP